ncbi:transcriptional regulator [Neobacillus sp. MM2021_6]|uniref:LexA family protein n=1 Tax=Bacillaceae TaxID=186817 RepID=UPI001409410B|nr:MULTISPECIES: transcriptional regulator [Bacillaceae]MBO0962455.1 transcriptional regulator [Neobacillus sp. MM2021_6]NHC21222.1 transcriptional regulator [Bacillus sp. MM2020_4]
MRKITQKQLKILAVLKTYIAQHGYPPSYRELAVLMNLVSSSTIKQHLDSLRKKGLVDWEEGLPRTLHIIEQKESSAN